MVDEDEFALTKEDEDWRIPSFDFGHPMAADEIHQTVSDAVGDPPSERAQVR